jgi:prolyl oligopeptidase
MMKTFPALFTCLFIPSLSAAWDYPDTRQVDRVQDYHGIMLKDEYEWMEAFQTEESKAWYEAQNQLTHAIIGSIPGRDALFERIMELDTAKETKVFSFNRAGDRYFYQVQELEDEVGSLYYRDGLHGESKLIVDPADFAESAEHISEIDSYSVSPNGKTVSFTIAAGGSDIGTLYIVDVESGEPIDQPIPRVRWAGTWHQDEPILFYSQLRIPGENEPRVDHYKRTRAKMHRLGEPIENDPILVSYDHNPELGMAESDGPFVTTLPGCDYLVLFISHGVERADTLFISPLAEGIHPNLKWSKLFGKADEFVSSANLGNDLYLLSRKDTPYYRVLKGNLDHWDKDQLVEVIPETDTVLTGMQTTASRLYVAGMRGGVDTIFEVEVAQPGFPRRELDLPLEGRAALLPADPGREDVFFSFTSWIQAPAYYHYDPATRDITQTDIRPLGKYDHAPWVEVREVHVRSHDGTRVPLTILYKRGLELNGRNPVLLRGYGAYGISQRPSHSVIRLAWLEQGGIYAVAKVRGGGEFGDKWHRAGWQATKANTWKDFIACAQYLIDAGYTEKGRIGGNGGSAGGILISRAMIAAPDLWGAMVNAVGVNNPVRNHKRANGPANNAEYGNPLDPEQFPYVLAMDGYHNLRKGAQYPAVLYTAGYNDSRVPPWQPGKILARMQALDNQTEPFLLRTEFGGGHNSFARTMTYALWADIYAFLFWQLGHPDFQQQG